MLPTHFIASALPTNDGYTWTLPSRLGVMLREVEARYGPRSRAWTILGVEFGPGPPQIWYPGSCGNIIIQLASNALASEMLACYQLAHECVHLLDPQGGGGANVLEEGLATNYAEDYVLRNYQKTGLTNPGPYLEAMGKVRRLLVADQDAVLKLRRVEPSFRRMDANTFAIAQVSAAPEFVAELLARFA